MYSAISYGARPGRRAAQFRAVAALPSEGVARATTSVEVVGTVEVNGQAFEQSLPNGAGDASIFGQPEKGREHSSLEPEGIRDARRGVLRQSARAGREAHFTTNDYDYIQRAADVYLNKEK